MDEKMLTRRQNLLLELRNYETNSKGANRVARTPADEVQLLPFYLTIHLSNYLLSINILVSTYEMYQTGSPEHAHLAIF